MPDLTFNDMIQEMFKYYNAKDYVNALAVLDREGSRFPERAAHTYYNRACMISMQNQPADAIRVLREAADKGFWYTEHQLREDADLASLQGNPEFEELVACFRDRVAALQAQIKPECLDFAPKTTAPYPLVLALHGNASNAAETQDFWKPVVGSGWLLGVLQSSQLGFTKDNFIWDDEATSMREVQQHLGDLRQKYDVDTRRVVIGGFSMGGRITTLLGLTQPFPIKGFIGIGPYLTGKMDELAAQLDKGVPADLRVYLIVGDQDHECYPDTIKFADLLKAHHIPYKLKVYPGMAHVYPPDFAQVAVEALQFITAS